jgi:basic membrane protein A and related proteins
MIMTKLLPAALLAAAAWVGATPLGAARADTIKPAILFDMGGKFDKGFNEGVYNGGQSFTKATGIKIQEFEVQNEGQREQGLRNFAKRGDNPILAIGFAQADGLTVVAKEFPKTHFGIIDAVVDLPNVRSFTFKEHEGSYLVGMLAAMASPGAKVGFVGGMDIPLIRKFECGYKQGAKAVDPNIEILSNMTGSTPAAWNDPVRGGELAKSQMERGATVVYAAAGATSLGVYQAVADAGKLAIGVDSDVDYLHPGHMLTSMVKHVDVATEDLLTDAKGGKFTAGHSELGLKENGVDVAFDKENASLIKPEWKAKIEQAKQDIISGKVQVHDYTADNACPF